MHGTERLILTEFQALGLNNTILKTLRELGYDTPTDIQRDAIPHILEGRDVMGLAQTGTGKTAAFGLPLVQQLTGRGRKPDPKTARSLILAPTRELAGQIAVNLRSFMRGTPMRVSLVVGGAPISKQIRDMQKGTDVLVATPGRLIDLIDRRAVDLNEVRFLVLDEADQMLDLGFIHTLRKIATYLGSDRQTLLFSATMPKHIDELSRTYLKDPVRIEAVRAGRSADKVRQSVHLVRQADKFDLLKSCLLERQDDLSLVFARTKHGAEKLMKRLVAAGIAAGSVHGNKSQGQRDRAIKAFRSGNLRVLVATDVAARGIDIPGVSHVYNFDLPNVAETYVHRIGRTARAGADGEAVAFCSPEEQGQLRDIEKLIATRIEVVGGELSPEAIEAFAAADNARRGPKRKPKFAAKSFAPGKAPRPGRRARKRRAAKVAA